MDTIQIGTFIAALRKESGLTQEQLGEKLGVTNKTVSRWETGLYLPPADALLRMGELFGVSVNELLTGRRLSDADYKKSAEENLTRVIRASSFSRQEKSEFFKKKWLKDHAALLVLIGIVLALLYAAGFVKKNPLLISLAFLLLLPAHAWRNNAMMAYVERHLYEETE